MIERKALTTILELAEGYPFIAITGPRQAGKTTLSRMAFPDKPYVSLEDPDTREFAASDPRRFLARYPDGAILDEAQRSPDLFSYLQTRADMDGRMGLYILTGSQQFGLLSGITQSLAGRVGMVQLLPFSSGELQEAGKLPETIDELLYKGSYPPLYNRKLIPAQWYAGYVTTYLERDVRQLIHVRDLAVFQRFIRLCAGRTGQLLNLSALANDCGITHNTARAWISILEASYILFRLPPHHRNFNKRLVKTPKLYFYDTGLAAWLLGVQSADQISIHPLRGALFETWVMGELLKERYNRSLPSNLFFWRDNTGNEVDVIVDQGLKLIPIEIKSGGTISADYFSSLRKWISWAGAAAGNPYLIYGGEDRQQRQDAEVVPWREVKGIADVL
jgi:predicted AAA+ superfamily ATPase